jgi:hypothetical protein
MGTFNSSKTITTAIAELDGIETAFKQHFENAGYTVNVSKNADGFFASITKTDIFKVVLGMKTSLNVEVKRIYNGVQVDAKVGVFGQQLIPSVISLFVFWPVILTQIAGFVQQSKLDEEAIRVIEDAIRSAEASPAAQTATRQAYQQLPAQQTPVLPPPQTTGKRFCSTCGTSLEAGVRFCGNCGAPAA